jgi:hypothetical protein
MTTLESLTRNNAYSLGSARANLAHNLGPNPASDPASPAPAPSARSAHGGGA